MSYTAFVTREGPSWLAEMPELDGASSYASTLSGLLENLREVAILAAELEDDAEVEIELDFQTASTVVRDAADLRRLRSRVDRDLAVLRSETPVAVDRLLAQGFSVPDTAVIVGISPARLLRLADAEVLVTAEQQRDRSALPIRPTPSWR